MDGSNGQASASDTNVSKVPATAQDAVFVKSESLRGRATVCKGYDFNEKFDFERLMTACLTTGFQATNFARAIEEINRMRRWRLSDRDPLPDDADDLQDPEVRKNIKCTIFLSYTSNMVSCGLREVIRFLAQHKMIDCIVTTAGGVEEDLIKCLEPTFLGEFGLDGRELRLKGINRIGNLLVPNENYCKFEDWIRPVLHAITDEQAARSEPWTPSTMIDRMGKEIDNPESIYYWCHRNRIPVFCPAITDGSIGDMIYFHKYKRPEFILDVTSDIKAINDIAVSAHATGMIILGGGVVKHHTCNANLMRNGADFSVFINTGSEFDGSDSGANPSEAISWGKIRMDARPVKLHAEATLVFPLIVAETFAKNFGGGFEDDA